MSHAHWSRINKEKAQKKVYKLAEDYKEEKFKILKKNKNFGSVLKRTSAQYMKKIAAIKVYFNKR